ncbi:MAG: ATP-dependent DNA helicase [Lautropia sp.]|nr:ATP-dependent DNA helicase [Lautropia sp.]
MHTASGESGGSYVIAVRSLCEFTARRGDLDLRFTPAPTSQEGIAGHQLVASRRPPHYQTELSLSGSHGRLLVRGRADGFDPLRQQLEEIKTHRGDLGAMPANHRELHWAQAKVYAWLLCRQLCLAELNVALVYFDIVSRDETVLVQRLGAAELEAFFEDQCSRFLQWARQEMAHRERRDVGLQALAFAHPQFRPGQRTLAEAVYRAALKGRCLMAQAPTGIGKTIGTLFPMLKACPTGRLDKVFYLAAKASGRKLALDALGSISAMAPRQPVSAGGGEPALPDRSAQPAGLALRILELVARDKACVHPDKACHGESCPLARGFHDRLPAARSEAVAAGGRGGQAGQAGQATGAALLDQATVRAVGLAHQVCPYYLTQDLTRWCDVVVGDYNYYFDLNAILYGLALANQWRVGVLVDEAHNLVARARGMYSASLDQRELQALRRSGPESLRPVLTALGSAWNAVNRDQQDDYQACAELPRKLLVALQKCSSAIADHLADHADQAADELLRLHFDVLHFLKLAESFGKHSLFDVSRFAGIGRGRGGSVLCLRNVVPAGFLAPRLAAAATTTMFSATLGPRRFQEDMLGLPQTTAWLDVESPFSAAQLAVHVISRISTRYREREASITPIVQLLARQYRCDPGNYLAFFSSFEYMQRVAHAFAREHPQIALRQQFRGMTEAEQADYLARFEPARREIAFAVLGGSFAEAIDLPGDRLRGAFVATLGLPQVNPVNEQMRRRMQDCFGAGFDYAYLYPGLQKVVQAAGRVIRTPEDRGVLYLIDDRFSRPEVRRLLPAWWDLESGS